MKSALAVLNFVRDNYIVILAIIATGVGVYLRVRDFLKKDADEQKKILESQADNLTAAINSGLLALVTSAEKKYGSGTGILKQSDVYNEVIKAFPSVIEYMESGVITADYIKKCIDRAVDEFNRLREQNKNLDKVASTEEKE